VTLARKRGARVSSSALQHFAVTVGLESSPPKLGPLVSALDEALSR